METNFKVKPWRSKPFLSMVKTLDCCACNMTATMGAPVIPHHHQPEGCGTMGGKIGDEFTVPLCHWCHMELHDNGRGEWSRWQVDPMAEVERTRRVWLDMGNKPLWLAP